MDVRERNHPSIPIPPNTDRSIPMNTFPFATRRRITAAALAIAALAATPAIV